MSIYKIAEQFVLNKLKKLENGRLRLSNHDGEVFNFGKNSSPLNADITIANKRFYLDIILGGSSALGEAYVNKEFETSDLTKLIEITARNIQLIYTFSGSAKLQTIKNLLKKIFMSNTRSKSLKYISKHYDLGNEFFAKWLDKTLTYSSAIYENKNDDLETAQKNKYRKLIDLLNLKSGDKVLEIGCGWGGFSEFVAKKYEVSVDCITISKKQFEYAKKRIFLSGLNNKVNVKFLDYRDIKNKYDKVASIEMIEAVGEKYLNQYFRTIKKSLNKDGLAAIQGITIKDDLFDRYRMNEDFIQKYIFPGGFLPSLNSIKNLTKNNNLHLEKVNFYSEHYARTLSIWRKNFYNSWKNILPLGFDNTFRKIWEFYLSYCEAGFKSKNIDLIQFSMSNK
mgnify:FL=1|tara:strand:- start:485 stop:1666 length:1182 start_codon:yes stop_codon:yes gene_type:complete